MIGQMCWLSNFGSDSKILHLRLQPHLPWQPYTAFPNLAVSDYDVPGGSKGFATYHQLYRAGWQLVATKDAHQRIMVVSSQKAA